MQRCNQKEITAIKTSKESHLFWKKKHFRIFHDISGYTQFLRQTTNMIIVI